MAPPTSLLAVASPRPARSCRLLALPPELILDIVQPLDLQNLSHLMRACRYLFNFLGPSLHSLLIAQKDAVLTAACLQNNTAKLRVAVAAGAKPGLEHLASACRSKATAIVIILLDEHALPAHYVCLPYFRHLSRTMLHTLVDVATRSFDLATIEALLARGAVLRPPGGYWGMILFEPMIFAMLHARWLLPPFVERGYHLHHLRFRRRTGLTWAVHFGCVDTVKLLLKHGADVNEKPRRSGMCPLHVCCEQRGESMEMLNLLLEAGADVDEPNRYSQSSLQIAMLRGDVEAVKVLVKRTKKRVHRICWFPVRCRWLERSRRRPEFLPGRLECWRIVQAAGIYTSDEDITNPPAPFSPETEGEREDM